jgi:hypothetical protein
MDELRELDVQVVEALGWTEVSIISGGRDGYVVSDVRGKMPDGRYGYAPHFSTDIAAAWELVEWMRREGWNITFQIRDAVISWPSFRISGYLVQPGGIKHISNEGHTAPEAICRAFLAAVGDNSGA